MLAALRRQYAPHLAELDQIMSRELARWRSADIEQLWSLTHAQLQRRGKQLRPLLSFMMADHLGGDPAAAIPAAAGVEFYHLASLILDDVQDHAEIRRGEPTVAASAGASTAVNMALFVRSLSYHVVHQGTAHDPAQRVLIHQELDHAATHLILGQSIDIGWHEKWYENYREFPYLRMIEGKSGALFGCAAAAGACAIKASLGDVDAARDYGVSFGVLYQMVDDYLDVFGEEGVLHRPQFEDFREGKMTAPVIRLLFALRDDGHQDEEALVLTGLAGRDPPAGGWGWLLELMRVHDIGGQMRKEISERASCLAESAVASGHDASAGCLAGLVKFIVAPAGGRE
jgi:geranylgeranyl pyrophosphate synthase